MRDEAKERPRRDANRRRDVESTLEARVERDVEGNRSGVGVRVAVRDEHGGGAPVPGDLQRRLPELRAAEHAHELVRERDVAGTPAVLRAAERIDAPHELRVEPDTGREREAPTLDPAEADAPAAIRRDRVRDPLRRAEWIARKAERAREHARPTARE